MTSERKGLTFSKLFQRLSRFDRLVFAAILGISVLLCIILVHGDRTTLRATNFSWSGKKVGIQDKWFTLSFNRPIEPQSMAQNLTIEPPLAGKISWSGRNLAYTLTELPIYGLNYQLKLENAKELDAAKPNKTIEPFVNLFSTRDRAFAYIGVRGEERGRLILSNITQQTANILTPPDLVVTDFALYPDASKVLFSAFERSQGSKGLSQQQLYTVTTGLNFQSPQKSQRIGRIQRILANHDYQNLAFDLSNNGKTIVVQRANRPNPLESGLWVVPESGEPRPLGIPGNQFMVSPDGQTVAVSQRGGIAIFPLTTQAASEFFPGYEKILGFSQDGSQKLVVKNNLDYTRSLVLINQEGQAKELSKSINPIISCEFEPRDEKTLYCLKTDVVTPTQGQFREEPFLSVINLERSEELPLFSLPNYKDVQMSMSPDGVALLFDQIVTTLPTAKNELITQGGNAIADGRLLLLPLSEIMTVDKSPKILPQELNSGFKPRWLP